MWIEITPHIPKEAKCPSRSPHGECGLKCVVVYTACIAAHSRSPHGECGLKCSGSAARPPPTGRSPHGECGLKYYITRMKNCNKKSLPAWGVWIEIGKIQITLSIEIGRSPHGECGLKFEINVDCCVCAWSLPAWGVWIEMLLGQSISRPCFVAPRMGSVD